MKFEFSWVIIDPNSSAWKSGWCINPSLKSFVMSMVSWKIQDVDPNQFFKYTILPSITKAWYNKFSKAYNNVNFRGWRWFFNSKLGLCWTDILRNGVRLSQTKRWIFLEHDKERIWVWSPDKLRCWIFSFQRPLFLNMLLELVHFTW